VHDIDENGEQMDLLTAKALSAFSRTTSRRGLLAAGGRLFLKALGVSLLPLLPFDRTFAQAGGGNPTDQDCSDWQYCGIHGFFCQACCGGGPYITSCPPCTNQQTTTFWSVCCCCPGCNKGQGYTVKYIDCCGVKTGYTAAQAQTCTKKPKCKNTATANWCGGTGTYYCTIVSVSPNPCKGCSSNPLWCT
jgi:hypothetical protein